MSDTTTPARPPRKPARKPTPKQALAEALAAEEAPAGEETPHPARDTDDDADSVIEIPTVELLPDEDEAGKHARPELPADDRVGTNVELGVTQVGFDDGRTYRVVDGVIVERIR